MQIKFFSEGTLRTSGGMVMMTDEGYGGCLCKGKNLFPQEYKIVLLWVLNTPC